MRSEQCSEILFDKMDHISFGSMSRFELIFNNANPARRSSPIRLRKWVCNTLFLSMSEKDFSVSEILTGKTHPISISTGKYIGIGMRKITMHNAASPGMSYE